MRLISPFERTNRATLAANFFKDLIRDINLRRDLGEHFRENTSLLAYKVAEHTSQTGEHYITTTRKEYKEFTLAAMGGGFVIAFTNWVKFLIAYLDAAPLLSGLLYSINYAGSFITMQVFHFSLATKQPAMTASALARSLDSKDADTLNLETAADMITKISRSQFASFLGNLIVVIPLAFALSWLWYWISGSHIASEEKALSTLAAFHPFKSLTVIYAMLTGAILYLGGFVTGYFDNFVAYSNLGLRVQQHRFWRRLLPASWLTRIGDYLEHNLGGLMGNIFLGFAIGYATCDDCCRWFSHGSSTIVGAIDRLGFCDDFTQCVSCWYNELSVQFWALTLIGAEFTASKFQRGKRTGRHSLETIQSRTAAVLFPTKTCRMIGAEGVRQRKIYQQLQRAALPMCLSHHQTPQRIVLEAIFASRKS